MLFDYAIILMFSKPCPTYALKSNAIVIYSNETERGCVNVPYPIKALENNENLAVNGNLHKSTYINDEYFITTVQGDSITPAVSFDSQHLSKHI
ncbi:hypothetical protein DPMN_171419 [Dreissena polymorpha]|uniref:Uncharacterized protein n=1 Tax=Dreissena polymorpha TaxID=45954 RepID=A0A9D4ICE2_DREPO|nr:hypothetical protein DPMN_171419 [Dreissena polymorpha]